MPDIIEHKTMLREIGKAAIRLLMLTVEKNIGIMDNSLQQYSQATV
jgi:hypothetical protein